MISTHAPTYWAVVLIEWCETWQAGLCQHRNSGCGTGWLLAGAGFLPLWQSVSMVYVLRCFSCSHTVLPKEQSGGYFFSPHFPHVMLYFFFPCLPTCISLLIVPCMSSEMQVGRQGKRKYSITWGKSCISLLIVPCMIVYVTNNKEPWTLNSDPTALPYTFPTSPIISSALFSE